jgi:hypothetical protein
MFKMKFFVVVSFVLASLGMTASEASAQWKSVPYDAGNFTASGAMTWTVEQTDQVNFRYMVNDRTMTVALVVKFSSVGGTAHQELQIKIPGGFKAGSQMFSMAHLFRDSGSPAQEIATTVVNPDSDIIKIYRPAWVNQQLSSNVTHLYFTITFDLCDDTCS